MYEQGSIQTVIFIKAFLAKIKFTFTDRSHFNIRTKPFLPRTYTYIPLTDDFTIKANHRCFHVNQFWR